MAENNTLRYIIGNYMKQCDACEQETTEPFRIIVSNHESLIIDECTLCKECMKAALKEMAFYGLHHQVIT
jgi:hypothetical protein